MKEILFKILITFVYVGWVVPIWFGLNTLLSTLTSSIFEKEITSFPTFEFLKIIFTFGFAWMSVSLTILLLKIHSQVKSK